MSANPSDTKEYKNDMNSFILQKQLKSKIMKTKMMLFLCALALAQFAKAEDSKPLQLAIFNPVQLVPEKESITGLRLSLFYTVNKNVTGLFAA